MADGDEKTRSGLRFVPDVRLGDILTIGGIAIAVLVSVQKSEYRIASLERGQVQQAETQKEIRQEIQSVSLTIRAEMKEQGASIRRIEDKINRARM